MAEGSPASFKAVLSGTVANAVVVSWTTAAGGTAISGTDYTAQAAASLTIAAGATSSGAFTVATAADTLSEGDETFQVQIAADSGKPAAVQRVHPPDGEHGDRDDHRRCGGRADRDGGARRGDGWRRARTRCSR